ncbi:hypothetical protein P3X46_007304 [Hevea brasiliensis]|uniref:Uncharacterized protein n=1 Tax=Hevea brasiliensis TaxID=3981 RepID=A0ABQ9MU45_HEVBR|nr:uncharacterized protein LOC110663380 isoform X2 [Hevea brasiliensis]KAJ9183453.1 hypothetical protein P3X46_007304 [Hevea brasiliensis]
MATNTAATRESRRRKILERGADRLALITDRTQTLPSESDDKPHPDSSQQFNSHQDSPPDLSDRITASRSGDNAGFVPMSPNNDSTIDAGHIGSHIEPPLSTHAAITETSVAPAYGGSNGQSSIVSSTDQKSTLPTSSTVQHLTGPNSFVTPRQISSAISASESSRLFSSVAIALFVVLSNLGFPLLGSNIIRSIISYRPLYLVLLTSLTLVLARLLFNNQRGFERAVGGEHNMPSTSKYDWAEQAGKALEVGLVMQKAIEAVFMDCSVYVLIVIAGFTFVK